MVWDSQWKDHRSFGKKVPPCECDTRILTDYVLSRYCHTGWLYYSFDIFIKMLPKDQLIKMFICANFNLNEKTGNKNNPKNSEKLLK